MDRETLLELVKSSPEIVARHDREAWLGLFSSDAVVEDPVGAGSNRKGADWKGGRDGLARFYDVFIAPNDIAFTVHRDIVADDEVVRDVTIRTVLPNGAVSLVDAYLIYRCTMEGGRPAIKSLQAHWEFGANALGLLRHNGLRGMAASLGQFVLMLRIQGVRRTARYCSSLWRGISRGRGGRAVRDFVSAVNRRDREGMLALCEAGAAISNPAGISRSADDFFSQIGRLTLFHVYDLRSAGWYCSCTFKAVREEEESSGIALFAFSPRSGRIESVLFYRD
ncbi:MAG: nuclear transport factor 2 family protein [Spirochaetes bacterium]|nr:nuclear transport factor 2 family protein [Spirochaetota bacterium]